MSLDLETQVLLPASKCRTSERSQPLQLVSAGDPR